MPHSFIFCPPPPPPREGQERSFVVLNKSPEAPSRVGQGRNSFLSACHGALRHWRGPVTLPGLRAEPNPAAQRRQMKHSQQSRNVSTEEVRGSGSLQPRNARR